jgi:antitoxin HicB
MSKEPLDLESYPFTIRPLSSEDGAGFLIQYRDIPGCMSDGETPAAAILNARDALKSALRTLREFGDPTPKQRERTK